MPLEWLKSFPQPKTRLNSRLLGKGEKAKPLPKYNLPTSFEGVDDKEEWKRSGASFGRVGGEKDIN
jgi:hypothetical protein